MNTELLAGLIFVLILVAAGTLLRNRKKAPKATTPGQGGGNPKNTNTRNQQQ